MADIEKMETVLGETSSIQGDLKVAHGITIAGNFKGTLKSGGKVIIGVKGDIEADIEAEEVITAGKVLGNVTAKRKLIVQRSGKIIGDVKTAKLILEEGGIINGSIDMGQNVKKNVSENENEKEK